MIACSQWVSVVGAALGVVVGASIANAVWLWCR